MRIIALTGGIGSGKSVVSALLRVMGYPVYDCDSRAKLLMDNSEEIKSQLVQEFGREAVSPEGVINRRYVASKVFGNDVALKRLNGIVHPAVREDLLQWAEVNGVGRGCVFVETAILRSSNLGEIVDDEWTVAAPHEVRIERVMRRNGLPREAVEARINAQAAECATAGAKVIVNDGKTALLPQVARLLV